MYDHALLGRNQEKIFRKLKVGASIWINIYANHHIGDVMCGSREEAEFFAKGGLLIPPPVIYRVRVTKTKKCKKKEKNNGI